MKKEYVLWIKIILSGILLYSCIGNPDRDFTDTDLLIDVSAMPENWELVGTYTMDNDEGEVSGNHIVFYRADTPYWVRSGQRVYRYSSSRKAARHYRQLEDYYFTPNVRETPPVIPEGFDFTSAVADQWRFGCMDSTFSPAPEFGNSATICQYIAQYDEFLVFVTMKIRLGDQEMASMDDVYRLMEAVDQKMAQYLAP